MAQIRFVRRFDGLSVSVYVSIGFAVLCGFLWLLSRVCSGLLGFQLVEAVAPAGCGSICIVPRARPGWKRQPIKATSRIGDSTTCKKFLRRWLIRSALSRAVLLRSDSQLFPLGNLRQCGIDFGGGVPEGFWQVLIIGENPTEAPAQNFKFFR